MNEGRTQFQVDPGTGYRKTLGTFKNEFEIIEDIVNILFSNAFNIEGKEGILTSAWRVTSITRDSLINRPLKDVPGSM